MREQMPTPVGSRGLVLPLGAASLVALLGVLAACKDDKVEDEKAPPESPNRATLADNAHGVKREPLAIDLELFGLLARVVVPQHLDEPAITRRRALRDDNAVNRTILRTGPPQTNRDHVCLPLPRGSIPRLL